MSVQQRNDHRVLAVDRPEALVVLPIDSHHFDDVERRGAVDRRALRAFSATAV